MARRCRARSRSTTPSCSPTRTSTRWRGCSPTAEFEQQIREQFDGDYKISFNLAPPILLGGVDALGRPKKRAFGPWMMKVFRTLAKLRFLRGTPLDIFSYSADRKLERELIAGYEKDVATVLVAAVAGQSRDRGRTAVAAGPHPRLRPGEGEGGAGSQGALRGARRRPRQPAAGATADRGGVGRSRQLVVARSAAQRSRASRKR